VEFLERMAVDSYGEQWLVRAEGGNTLRNAHVFFEDDELVQIETKTRPWLGFAHPSVTPIHSISRDGRRLVIVTGDERGTPLLRAAQRVTDALERVGMSHRMKHYPAQLSGGQQQRVAVARAVAGDPLILLADEPTGNLDSTNGEAVMELLRELHRGGATICMVTHDPRYAAHADRSIHLFDGRVVEEQRHTEARA
jgi:ABC-type glutathione transport system ATPase component